MLRTHTCGELGANDIGKKAVLCGWVDTRRDHGNLIFVDVRDRWGRTQVVFNPAMSAEVHKVAEGLRSEFVIRVTGEVSKRPAGTENTKLSTGLVEIVARELEVLNSCPTPPFEVTGDQEVTEELRLKYRFLDIRRSFMVKNLTTRFQITKIARDYFAELGFLEIETPYLTKSTPEGSRDFLVPARLSPGAFYALPQSPQLFKQILMVAGIDRYFQIVRCFRDEDLRADRQPEHTQLDVEMSFVTEDDVMGTIENLVAGIIQAVLGLKIPLPLRRLSYDEAMNRFGSDKPDLRFGMEIGDVTEILRGSQSKIFEETFAKGGVAKALTIKDGAKYSRKELDELTKIAQDAGAKGLAWFKVGAEIESPLRKFFSNDQMSRLLAAVKAAKGDLVLIVADQWLTASTAMGVMRLHLARTLNLIPKDRFELLWVVDFPLLEWNEEEKRIQACHHPFTSPKLSDVALLDKEPLKVKARAYDLVLNGAEIGGGSIRIHSRDLQKKIFDILGITDQDAEVKFGFLLKALSFGAPPHGGIALGLDRVTTVLLGLDSIRDVIAFPKTQKGICLMSEAPSEVSEKQLKELGVKVERKIKENKPAL